MILLIIAYCFGRVNANFLYPLKSEILGFEAYTVYLLAFFGFSTQIISITLSSYLPMKYLKRIPIISLIALIILSIFLAMNSNFFIFILLFLFLGFFTGILYGSALKLVLILNIKKILLNIHPYLKASLVFLF